MGMPVVHWEITAKDAPRLEQFYHQMFDWNVTDAPLAVHPVDTGRYVPSWRSRQPLPMFGMTMRTPGWLAGPWRHTMSAPNGRYCGVQHRCIRSARGLTRWSWHVTRIRAWIRMDLMR